MIKEGSKQSFGFVEEAVRKRKFGVLGVVDSKGRPHSTGIMYGVSHPDSEFALYVITQAKAAKVRHIKKNQEVSLTVTFPHYYLRFVPDSYVMFRGTADFVPLDDEDVQWAFQRASLQVDSEAMHDLVVIRIRPRKTVYVYGLGIGMNQLRKDPTSARYKVTIPSERLVSPEVVQVIARRNA
ncbi:MAG: pyridoxamine 5'-phosphate oxidase family protein [Candidatus Thorarchaeota archaeon]|nr:MAG: pyridoxamine 5'-phosphate oxidase family protein [Candidatus Thorarchaeota archaeon]